MKNALFNWLSSAVFVIILAYLLPGIHVSGFLIALLVALFLGLANTFIRPVATILTLPLNILTLGLFTFVINAILVLLVAAVVPGFSVSSFWWALLFGIALSAITSYLKE